MNQGKRVRKKKSARKTLRLEQELQDKEAALEDVSDRPEDIVKAETISLSDQKG